MTTVSVALPDVLAKEAAQAGLRWEMEYVILAVLAIVFLNMLHRGFLLLCGS